MWPNPKQLAAVFYKKAALKNYAKFTKKHLCRSLSIDKVEDFKPATLLKGDPGTGVFYKFGSFSEQLFSEHLWKAASVIINIVPRFLKCVYFSEVLVFSFSFKVAKFTQHWLNL